MQIGGDKIELGKPGEFDRPMTPEEIIDRLEQRIGHEGRVIFENFVREIQRLEARQQVEQQQQQQQEQERRQERRQRQLLGGVVGGSDNDTEAG